MSNPKAVDPNMIKAYDLFAAAGRPLSITDLRAHFPELEAVPISNLVQSLTRREMLIRIGKVSVHVYPSECHPWKQTREVYTYGINPAKTRADLVNRVRDFKEPTFSDREPLIPCEKKTYGYKTVVRFGKGHKPGSGQGRLVGPAIGAGTMASVMAQGD